MADPNIPGEAHIAKESELLNRAIWRKWNKFTWSGLFLIVIGLVVITIGLLLNTGAYSAEGLLVGIGAIVVLIGIVRLLIGIINPLSPRDLRTPPPTLDQIVIDGEAQKDSQELI